MSLDQIDRVNKSRAGKVFWGEVSPCEHAVQIYGNDEVFLDSLEGFVVAGLRSGEAVVIIATGAHRAALEQRLANYGWDVAAAEARNQYIALDADETLAKFMVAGWPDDRRFTNVVTEILQRARSNHPHVRAFGEMVALMWARGLNGATVRLEHLWHELCLAKGFPLFCAYPRSGFTQDASTSIREICAAHSRVIEADSLAPSLQTN